jgi:hypothetical protein
MSVSGALTDRASSLERTTLPVVESLAAVFPDGLVHGRSVLCSGDAAVTLALATVSAASRAGSWLAVFGVDDLGLLAAHEQGVALQRTVLVTPPESPAQWSAAVGAAVDGFELLLLEVPLRLSPGEARKVQQRVLSRRGVLVLIDIANRHRQRPIFQPDVMLHATTIGWDGIGRGHGHVRGREVHIDVAGRRVPKPRRVSLHITH